MEEDQAEDHEDAQAVQACPAWQRGAKVGHAAPSPRGPGRGGRWTALDTVGIVFIIFGLRTSYRRYPTPFLDCVQRGHQAAQVLVKRSTKFSLFFIPLFPVRPARYHLECVGCGAANYVEPADAAKIIAA